MSEPLVCLQDYGFQYRAQAAPTLFNIHFALHEGEKVLIVGPSGSGKSTLGNCINGLIPFYHTGTATGSAAVGGAETAQSNIFALSKIVGTVLQDPDGQFVGLSAAEDIAFALENECIPQEEMQRLVNNAAELVNISDRLENSPYDLSGGQKQRVSMAGVIVSNVRLLLFDEPLASLDPATGRHTIELIHELMHKTGTTVLIIEHRLEESLHREVDRILLVNHGRVLADMPPDDLLCTELLKQNGIREPLYLTALKYAGVTVTPAMRPAHMGTLCLTEADKDSVRRWYQAALPSAQPAAKKELLRVEGLRFAYPEGPEVLRGISFAVQEGEMTAIVGTNGAGKSTLAKLICGFEKPSAGSMQLRGAPLAGQSISERANHIGFVMQNPNEMISKTMIFDEVALGLRNRGVPEDEVQARVEKTLAICGLYPFRKWPISALSFGQKKRVTIASVLVMQPEIIILDEPTAGQDFKHYTEIMEFLRGLNANGVTVLMITHDMHLMLEYAPRALVFHDGELIADATAAQVLTDHALTKAASLKETSLYELASICGLADEAAAFVQHFIDYDRQARDAAAGSEGGR